MSNVDHIEHTLPVSKSNLLRPGIQLLIVEGKDKACPVRAMMLPLEIDTNLPPQAPLFFVGSTEQPTVIQEYIIR